MRCAIQHFPSLFDQQFIFVSISWPLQRTVYLILWHSALSRLPPYGVSMFFSIIFSPIFHTQHRWAFVNFQHSGACLCFSRAWLLFLGCHLPLVTVLALFFFKMSLCFYFFWKAHIYYLLLIVFSHDHFSHYHYISFTLL